MLVQSTPGPRTKDVLSGSLTRFVVACVVLCVTRILVHTNEWVLVPSHFHSSRPHGLVSGVLQPEGLGLRPGAGSHRPGILRLLGTHQSPHLEDGIAGHPLPFLHGCSENQLTYLYESIS